MKRLGVYLDEQLAGYGFGEEHPFNNNRFGAFKDAFLRKRLEPEVQILKGKSCSRSDLETFHSPDFIDFIIKKSKTGEGYLDHGDTPAFKGVYDTTCVVVGSTLDAVDTIMRGDIDQAFVPIAGLHHGYPNSVAGFCVFNDCGIAIKSLENKYGLKKIAYVDIDVHHGDGVYYAFEEDPCLIYGDIHQSPLYPGSGEYYERGKGLGQGLKLNIALPPSSGDEAFLEAFQKILERLVQHAPDFLILQCGADSLKGDPLAALSYTPYAHFYAARSLATLAHQLGHHRLLALCGGGYNLVNIGHAWTAVIEGILQSNADHGAKVLSS